MHLFGRVVLDRIACSRCLYFGETKGWTRNGWVIRQPVAFLDVVQVAAIVLGEVDRVVRNLIVAAIDAEVEHEG